jgi:phosphoribosylamine--glycine ligase
VTHNLLIVDIEQMGLPVALRCADAGWSVRLYRHMPKRPERYGEGFKGITLVDDWRASMQWAKDGLTILTGNFTLLHELQRYRDFGYPVFAPTLASAKLEVDRLAGIKAAEAVGIAIPEYHVFDSLEETAKFAGKSDEVWCFKPGGDEENKALTYVASDPEDLVGWLKRQIASKKQIKQCILQRKIDILSEIGVSGWVGPEGFLPDRFQLCFEHKKLCVGEHGPSTGEMGSVCQYMEADDLVKDYLLPMEPILKTLGHRGDFSFGGAVDASGKCWFFEWTARMGYPAWFIQQASHKGDPAQWMKDLLEGKDSLRVSYDVAIGVVMAQPPFPYQHDVPRDMVEGNPIQGVDEAKEQIHLCSVMMNKGKYETTGPYVAVATGLGKTISRAQDKVYKAVDAVRFPDRILRTDIGDKVKKALPALHRHGYARDLEA